MIIAILFKEGCGNVVNMKRFVDEHTGDEIAMPRKNPRPEDYEATFTGNTDDTFRIGLTVTKKSLKVEEEMLFNVSKTKTRDSEPDS